MENLNLKASLKPITGLRIDLTADMNRINNSTSNLGVDSLGNFNLFNMNNNGSYSASMITWRTAFVRDIGGGTDPLSNQTFTNMLNMRDEVSAVLGAANSTYSDTSAAENGYAGGYGSTQQDVILGSFIAAYTGKDVNEKNINPFKQIPLPNWRLTYDGLNKVKFLKKYIKNLSFSHAYRSNFSMGSYTTNLTAGDVSNGLTQTDISGNFISDKQIMTISIMEQFAPLLGIDMTLKNNLMAKIEIKKDRNIALSLSNNQITEIKGSELVIGSGYRFEKLQLPIKFNGKAIKPSDLNLRLDLSIRDNKTITRKIVEEQNQATAGQKMISIKFTGDYNLSQNLSIRFYFDRIVNKPFISTSFPTANTNAGFALRFMLNG